MFVCNADEITCAALYYMCIYTQVYILAYTCVYTCTRNFTTQKKGFAELIFCLFERKMVVFLILLRVRQTYSLFKLSLPRFSSCRAVAFDWWYIVSRPTQMINCSKRTNWPTFAAICRINSYLISIKQSSGFLFFELLIEI